MSKPTDIAYICIPMPYTTQEHLNLLNSSPHVNTSRMNITAYYWQVCFSAHHQQLSVDTQKIISDMDVVLTNPKHIDAYVTIAALTGDPDALMKFYKDTCNGT